jgi:hypothetical protein
VDKIRAMVGRQLPITAHIQPEVTESGNSNAWQELAGMWRDHPVIEEVEENVCTHRE